jgi:hypothetical protein
MPTLRLTNKAIETAVSARCFLPRGRKIFANSMGGIFEKILSLPTTPDKAKMTEISRFFF